jgi:hypothetical protein
MNFKGILASLGLLIAVNAQTINDCQIVISAWKSMGGDASAFPTQNCCGVNNIGCDTNNAVIFINWPAKNLKGYIPDSITNLSKLKVLYILMTQ